MESPKSKSIILSHRKDADGITSASILKQLYDEAQVLLSDYSDIVETLSSIRYAGDLFITDLALNDSTYDGFLKEIQRLAKSGARIQYIEHHPLKEEHMRKLEDAGVEIFHFTEESAAVLVYRRFEYQLKNSAHAKILAACGAITDMIDDGPLARKLVSSFDRQFLLYEASVLAFTIAMIRKNSGDNIKNSSKSLVPIVEELAKGELPHEIQGAIGFSQEFAENAASLLKELKKEGKRVGNFAYVRTTESSTGNVAYSLIGAFNVPVGMAYRDDGPSN